MENLLSGDPSFHEPLNMTEYELTPCSLTNSTKVWFVEIEIKSSVDRIFVEREFY